MDAMIMNDIFIKIINLLEKCIKSNITYYFTLQLFYNLMTMIMTMKYFIKL